MALPSRFGKYELLERIATGGMAEVFLARSFGLEGFEKRLVIKRILPDLARNPRIMGLFIQEAKVCAGLAHPNIVQIFELGKVGDAPYIAMEYIHGRDLARINRVLRGRGERFPIPLAVYAVARALRGMAYAHARTDALGRPLGLVHRDISPQNILVTFQGEVKLVDFGIAHLEAGIAAGKAGKQAYMAPEQAEGGPVDGRADVFSAGMVLTELLTGKRLWPQADPAERLAMLRERGVPDPRLENPQIPEALAGILARMLAVDPADRPNAALAAEELRAFLFASGQSANATALGELLRELLDDDPLPEPGNIGVGDLAARDLAREITRLGGDSASPEPAPATPRPAEGAGGPGERKPVVVLVGEVSGLTELSEVFGTDEVVRRHFELIRRIRRVVDRFGGSLERYQDDSFVVFWGVNRTEGHDLDRALAAAGALNRGMRLLARRGLNVGLAIGVHRGELAIGRSRGRGHHYLARGDTIKLAQRLCAEAELGQILVSDAVASSAGERFSFAPGPRLRRKNRPIACRTHVLTGRHARASAAPGRWLRRGGDLDVLAAAFTALGRGVGGVLVVRGDTGLGKSRLVREVRELARPRGLPFYAGRAEPFAEDLPFTPFRDLLSEVLGLDGAWDRATVLDRLDQMTVLGLTDGDRELLGALFAVEPPPTSDRRASAPEQSKEAFFAAAARLVRGLAEQAPVVLALEDTHNLDATERAMVAHVMRATAGLPVLFLFTSRGPLELGLGPPTWDIELGPLSLANQRALIGELLAAEEVEDLLLDRLAETAEGNPLYLTELVKDLRATGRVTVTEGVATLTEPESALNLPAKLESLFAARVDALDPALKATLQVASVIGVSFSPALLADATGIGDVRPVLDALGAAGMLNLPSKPGEGRASFANPLLWEVARRSILEGTARALHGRVADAIGRVYAGALEPHRQALATHCAAADRKVDAARHAGRLGELLLRQQLLEEAAGWWERGVQWIARADPGEAPDMGAVELLLRLRAGEAWALIGDSERALRHLEVAQDLAENEGDPLLEARALLALGKLYHTRGSADLAKIHLEMVQELCGAISQGGDPSEDREVRTLAVESLETLAMLALDAGSPEQAREACEEALVRAGDDDGLAARALLGLATDLLHCGQDKEAVEYLDRALAKAEAAGDRILKGRIINNVGIAMMMTGRYGEAIARFREATEIRQGLGYRRGVVVNQHNIGDAWLRSGDAARAFAAFQQSRDLAAELGWERGVVMNDAYLAFLEGMRAVGAWDSETLDLGTVLPSEADAALPRIQAAALEAERLHDLEISVTARWLLGRLMYKMGRLDEAREVLTEALRLAEQLNARPLMRDVEGALRPLTWAAGVHAG